MAEEDKHAINPLMDFLAGCLGGFLGVLVCHPLDTVKVHLQTQDPVKPIYKGTLHCMRTLIQQEGAASLYRGITSPMTGIALINAIVFGVYGNVQRAMCNPNSLNSHAVAGGIGGLCQSVVCSPIDLAKVRMQLQGKNFVGKRYDCPLQFILALKRDMGYRGTMRGLGFTVLRDVPGFATYFATYEYLLRQPWNSSPTYCLAVGGLAGCFSWCVTYPIDVVKTCIQADDPKQPKYKGYIDCILRSYKSGGWHFFFRGICSTMVRSFPMNTVCFYVVTLVNRWGVAGVMVSYPLDTVKVHLQVQDIQKPMYRGTWHCMAQLIRNDGVVSLYQGVTSPMVGIAAINAIVFGIYGNVQRTHKDPESLTSHAVAGGVAGLFQSVVCSPMELAKIRMQLQHNVGRTYDCPLEFLMALQKEHGFRSIQRGLVSTIVRDIPGFASYFVSYEYLMRQPWTTNPLYCLAVGGLAGCFSWVSTYPVDVVKTCIQAEDPKNPIYKGYPDCIVRNYKSGGLVFFFRGFASTMIRSFPMNIVCFYVVALFNAFLSIIAQFVLSAGYKYKAE